MVEKVLTIGILLKRGLIKKSTKVRLNARNLKELKLIRPLTKKKVVAITELHTKSLVKKGVLIKK